MLTAELVDAGLYGSMERYGDLCIHAVVDQRRSFAREELERALTATIADFPVLGRRYAPGFWRDRWLEVEQPLSASVHVADAATDIEGETARWTARSLDVTRERPLRLVSLPRARGSRLVFSVMHLAVDGGGAAAVGHVLGSHLYGRAPSAPTDRRRGLGQALERLRWYHLPVLARDLGTTLLQPLRTFAAGARERPYPASPGSAPSFRHVVVSAAELASIKGRVGARVSVNDIVVAAMARVTAGRSSRGEVPVLYTMDLRRYGAPRFTATNTSSILTAFVPRAHIGDLARTAAAVARITARHRASLVGPAFVLAPAALAAGSPHAFVRRFVRQLHPIVVDLPLSRGMMVTNVGKLDAGLGAFGSDVEDLRVYGPIVADLPVPAVVAYGFRDALHLELCAPKGLHASALGELEHELRAALELPPRG